MSSGDLFACAFLVAEVHVARELDDTSVGDKVPGYKKVENK